MYRILIPLSLFCILFNGSLFAQIKGELIWGQRQYELRDEDDKRVILKAKDSTIGMHWQPFEVAPLSLGTSFSMLSFNSDVFGETDEEPYLREVGLNALAWWSYKQTFSLYFKYRYIFTSDMRVVYPTIKKANINTSLEGYILDLGLHYAVVPIIDLVLVFSQGRQYAQKIFGERRPMDSIGLYFGFTLSFHKDFFHL